MFHLNRRRRKAKKGKEAFINLHYDTFFIFCHITNLPTNQSFSIFIKKNQKTI